MKYKWWDIGMKLHVPYHKLKEFKKEPESRAFAAVINYWLNGNVKDVPVTWRSLVAVLKSSIVDERGLAKTIMEKYCPSEQQKGQEWDIKQLEPLTNFYCQYDQNNINLYVVVLVVECGVGVGGGEGHTLPPPGSTP